MNIQETVIPIPTLHEGDIATLKQIAVFAAQEIAKKATRTDEVHQCTAALEEELRRINQLNFMKPEIEIQYRRIPDEFQREVRAFIRDLERKKQED